MATIDVKDATGATVAIEKPLSPGQKSAALSRPVALSVEDRASIDAIFDKLIDSPATQATLAAVLAKIIAAPATEAKQDTGNTSLASIASLLTTQASYLDGIEALIAATNSKDFASQTTLAAVLAKLIAAPATEAKQDSSITQETAINTVLGVKGDAKSTATDTTAITAMSVWKQISASVQSLVTGTVLAAGSALIGRAVSDASAAAGGISTTARLASAAASTNAANLKTTAGRVYSAQGYNAAAYPVYLVLYDAIANPPVPGSTTIRKKIPIPAGAAFALDWPVGLSFSTGIGYAFTKLAADADATALVAADILQFNLDYV